MTSIKKQVWVAVIGVAVLVAAYYLTPHNETPAIAPYTIRLSGTPGTGFAGSYDLVNARGNSTSHAINGTVPASYTVGPGTIMLSIAVHKIGSGGTLRLDLSQGKQHVVDHQTSSPYGGLTVATRLVSVSPGYYRGKAKF